MRCKFHVALHSLFWLVVSLGCGKRPPEFAEVNGVVRVSGKPHAGLVVRYLPDPAQGNSSPINATGKTNAQGQYTLQHVFEGTEGGGAVLGWHRVLIEDASRGPTPQGQTPPPPLIPMTYGSPATTPLVKEVKAGSQTIDLDIDK